MNKDKNGGKLLIVGSVAFDSVETPAGKTDMALGGSASFASIAASYWCTPLAVGIVGDDFGENHFERFAAHGVDTRGIERVAGKTFHWKERSVTCAIAPATNRVILARLFVVLNPAKPSGKLLLGSLAPLLSG